MSGAPGILGLAVAFVAMTALRSAFYGRRPRRRAFSAGPTGRSRATAATAAAAGVAATEPPTPAPRGARPRGGWTVPIAAPARAARTQPGQ